MKTTLGCIRRADRDFKMITEGDRVAVGVSGGKDSLLLLHALSLYRRVRRGDFSLYALMLTSGKEIPNASAIRALCGQLDVPLTLRHTELYEILFEARREENPCALCAKIRRGMLCDLCLELSCNKLALAHHREDALETLLMSLIFEGRLHTFHPKTWLSRSGVTVIRPMVYLPEKHVLHMKKELDLPVLENPCPANGNTKRQEMKELLARLSKQYPAIKDSMLSALQNDKQYGLWDKNQEDELLFPLLHSKHSQKRGQSQQGT
ncbi:MAG: tRNA 2-thiocytidine(32) synthetase TtcA [Clostridia bacterium]|nr:tRNA 2-thiocytidine(32) synthetase TtcA [Clostridia bacterium]